MLSYVTVNCCSYPIKVVRIPELRPPIRSLSGLCLKEISIFPLYSAEYKPWDDSFPFLVWIVRYIAYVVALAF